MPYVNIQITRGATRAQKAALVRDVTASLVRELGKRPEHIHVVLQEIAEEDWGFAGMLTDDWRRSRAADRADGTDRVDREDRAGGAEGAEGADRADRADRGE